MANNLLTDYQEIENTILATIRETLKNEGTEILKQAMKDATYTYVYDVYAGGFRRYEAGGLADTWNYDEKIKKVGNGYQLTLYNHTEFQGSVPNKKIDLPTVIVKGDARFRQPFPRDFLAGAEADLAKTQAIEIAIDNALKGVGFKVR